MIPMVCRLLMRMLREVDARLLAKFAWTFGVKGWRAVRRFERRQRRGEPFFPAFLMLSITDRCNLRCQGCWVTAADPPRELSGEAVDRLIAAANAHGSHFFGLLGGEPLLHPGLWDIMARHPDCYFQVFTNGTLLTPEAAERMRQLGNVTPLISIEGLAAAGDLRRGGHDVTRRAFAALDACRQAGLVTGVATSLCRSNLDDLASEAFLAEMIRRGVHYLWYYIYRPAGPQPHAELALGEDDILRLRRFLLAVRPRFPLVVIDAYWDHLGRAVCPGAMGLSHHVGPGGDLEFCPPIQFAVENAMAPDADPAAQLRDSAFLREFRGFAAGATRGCILLEQPDALHGFLARHQPRDTSGRGVALAEIAALPACPGHHLPGREMPETHWLYRLAKRYSFFGFGAYG